MAVLARCPFAFTNQNMRLAVLAFSADFNCVFAVNQIIAVPCVFHAMSAAQLVYNETFALRSLDNGVERHDIHCVGVLNQDFV